MLIRTLIKLACLNPTYKTAFEQKVQIVIEERRIKEMQDNIGPYVPANIPVQVWA